MSVQPDIDGNVSQDDLLAYIDEYRIADEGVASALKQRRDVRQRIKESGFDIDAFDRTREEADKSGELRERQFHEFRRNMAWIGKPVGEGYVEAEVNGNEPTVKPTDEETQISDAQLDRIEDAGYLAGYDGRERSANPWTPGSYTASTWDNGWQRGSATRTEEGEDAPKRGPGRPPGARNKPKTRDETTH
jgi:ribosome modulation factor